MPYLRHPKPIAVQQKPWFVHFYALAAMIFWGISYIWSRIVFEYYPPATTVFLRLVISSLFLLLLIRLAGRNQSIRAADRKFFFLTALFSPFLYFVGESFGLHRVSPTISSVIVSTIPLFMPIAAFFVLKERLKPLNIIGLIISFTGVMVMVIDRHFSLTASPTGLLFLFLAVGSAIVYGLLLKKLTHQYNPVTIITYQNLIGILYFLPLVILLDENRIFTVSPDFRLLGSLLLLGIFASSLAFVFFVKAIKQIGIAKANIYTYLIPVFTAFFSLLILHERITSDKIAGIILVIFGLILSQQGKPIRIKQILIINPPIPFLNGKKKNNRFRRRPGGQADGH